jgi:hypothetical protein
MLIISANPTVASSTCRGEVAGGERGARASARDRSVGDRVASSTSSRPSESRVSSSYSSTYSSMKQRYISLMCSSDSWTIAALYLWREGGRGAGELGAVRVYVRRPMPETRRKAYASKVSLSNLPLARIVSTARSFSL